MKSWRDYQRTCMHGVREGLDDHSCSKCQMIALRRGFDFENGKTYIFFKDDSDDAIESQA